MLSFNKSVEHQYLQFDSGQFFFEFWINQWHFQSCRIEPWWQTSKYQWSNECRLYMQATIGLGEMVSAYDKGFENVFYSNIFLTDQNKIPEMESHGIDDSYFNRKANHNETIYWAINQTPVTTQFFSSNNNRCSTSRIVWYSGSISRTLKNKFDIYVKIKWFRCRLNIF